MRPSPNPLTLHTNRRNTQMALGLEDKLWFLSHPAIMWGGDFKVMDFGCADATVTRELARRVPHGNWVIGYDCDQGQIKQAEILHDESLKHIGYLEYSEEALDAWATSYRKGAKLLFLSSVLHETVSTHCESCLSQFIEEADLVVVRDMYWAIEDHEPPSSVTDKIYSRIHDVGYKDRLYSHEERHGFVGKSAKNLTHFMLKEQFKENWLSELDEDYFALSSSKVERLFERFVPVHFETFTLPWFHEWAKKEFGLGIIWPTHLKAIFKRVR